MKKVKKRKLDVLVLSDIHLGTFGCQATALLNYLKTVQPKILVLNGDIIDIWQFNKYYFPKAHMRIIKYLSALLTKGTKVYYVTGNHDEMLRKFVGFEMEGFKIVNKLVLNLDGEKAWIFHGDVFDVSMQHSKWLAQLGGKGYELLTLINAIANWFSQKMGSGRISLSKKIKESVKGAVKHINKFEDIAADIAIQNNYDYVVCGHIHQPQIRKIERKKGKTTYLNSGDWVENLTALEYVNKEWKLYRYFNDSVAQNINQKELLAEADLHKVDFANKELFKDLVKEFDGLSIKS